ncbi:unnamed protein product [Discula destructiva]
MPPKRKAAASTESGASGKTRLSKLARENDITAQEEAEIREAFALFSEKAEGEKDGVIPIGDVRRAMIALDIPPKDKHELAEFTAILDPEDEGYTNFASFVAICALKLHARDDQADDPDTQHAREVDGAFGLFTGTDAATGAPQSSAITMAHLRRVAAVLKEDVDDELLRDMILEANGGAGVGRGVKKGEFEKVMVRAGVWK